MIKQSADVGMMKGLRRRSIAVALGNFRVRHEQFDQRLQVRILERRHKLRQRSPEFTDVLGGLGQVVGEVDIAFFHAPQLVNRELKTILVLVDQPFDLEKVVLFEGDPPGPAPDKARHFSWPSPASTPPRSWR